MKLSDCWANLVRILNTSVLFSPDRQHKAQTVVGGEGPHVPISGHDAGSEFIALGGGADDGKAYAAQDGTPLIPVPKNPQEGPGRLTCEYPEMKEYVNCHGPDSRNCWVKHATDPNKKFDVDSDYENPDRVPVGITRKVGLDISADSRVRADDFEVQLSG